MSLVPTVIHSYLDTRVSDGLTTAAIPASLSGYDGRPSGRNASWGRRRFESEDWIERIYRSGTDEVKLTVVRSYDVKSLYHHPELAVAYGPSYLRTEIKRFVDRPEVPVRVLYGDTGTAAMYTLHYDGRFVEDPLTFQLRTAGELLFSGRKAMTLFFLTVDNVPADSEIATMPAIKLLFSAIDRFVAGAP
jgi:hypothetical protein